MALGLTAAGCGLIWHHWGDLYSVYQPSSAETHVFNETTAVILKLLAPNPLTEDMLKVQTERALGADFGDLARDVFASAIQRLEELGLIVRLEDTIRTECSSAR